MLKKLSSFSGIKGPLLTIVMDGVGISKNEQGNAVAFARKPTLDNLFAKYPNIKIGRASCRERVC
jgi:2,3-bisphosphoglycerate-independent phosphoglycerate mutase